MEAEVLHGRARERGVNRLVYRVARALLLPFALVFWRLRRVGREHIPVTGPIILAANHRSFLDPFLIGLMARRPIYYMAKRELFVNRPVAWLLSALGAYPVERGASDREAMATTRAILERGDGVLMFPEGTRTRPGPLGRPRRGVGRLALETGAAVVPVAIIGTEAVRRGWRIRPHRVRIRAGRVLSFPRAERPSSRLANAVTERIWPCVELQWEWLGGTPALRRAAVLGTGAGGAGLAAALARAGLQVDVEVRPGELELTQHDLVCLASGDDGLARVPERAGVLVLADGARAPALPPRARVASCLSAERLAPGATVALAGEDPLFVAEVAGLLRRADLAVTARRELTVLQPAVAA